MNQPVSVTIILLLKIPDHFNLFISGMELKYEQVREGNIPPLTSSVIQKAFGRWDYCSFLLSHILSLPALNMSFLIPFNRKSAWPSNTSFMLFSQDPWSIQNQCPKHPDIHVTGLRVATETLYWANVIQ